MKKNLIPALLILALAAGCTSKSSNGTSDTTTSKQPTPASSSGNITAQMIPPQLASQPIRVTTQPTLQPNSVNFQAMFTGLQTQSVKISNGATVLCTLTPTNPSCSQCAPQNPMSITVMPDTSVIKYNSVNNVPTTNPNNTGNLITTYSGANGNSVQITVQDQQSSCTGGTTKP